MKLILNKIPNKTKQLKLKNNKTNNKTVWILVIKVQNKKNNNMQTKRIFTKKKKKSNKENRKKNLPTLMAPSLCLLDANPRQRRQKLDGVLNVIPQAHGCQSW